MAISQDERDERISSDPDNAPVEHHDSVQRSLVGPFFDENWSNAAPIQKGSSLFFPYNYPYKLIVYRIANTIIDNIGSNWLYITSIA